MVKKTKKIIIDSDPERQRFKEFIQREKYKESEFSGEEETESRQVSITKDDIGIIKKVLFKHFYEETEKLKSSLKEEMEEVSQNVFNNAKFMNGFRKQTLRFIQEEVRTQVADFNVHHLIKERVGDYVKLNIKDVVEEIVTKLVQDINKKLSKDYRVAKELTYSINAEIKHTLMKLPISINTEEIVKKKINELLESRKIKEKILKITNGGGGK